MHGADFLSLSDKPQRDALAMLFLHLHGGGFDIAGIFWSLWLLPLGMLVYRSGFLPPILDGLLMLACFAYLAKQFHIVGAAKIRTRRLPMAAAACGSVVHFVASD